MFDIFYTGGPEWFNAFANGVCWFLIASVLAFLGWLAHDLVTGPKRQREEVKRMLSGLDAVQDVTGISPKDSLSGARRPFSTPKSHKNSNTKATKATTSA